MNLKNKIKDFFFKKEVESSIATGGFELLQRLTAGAWNKTKMLEQYEKSLYVFACVDKLATKIAATDFQLYQILNSQGDTKELMVHPALDLIYRVNPFQTKNEFLKITVINLKLAGDAFWYKVKNNSGKVVELWNLRPDFVEIIKDPVEFIKGYKFVKSDGVTVMFMPDEIVHFKHPTPLDEFYGTSPVRSAQVRIDTEDFASNYQRDFFLNNARPDAILKVEGEMTQDEKDEARSYFENKHRGVHNNSKVAILQGGLEYQQISVTQKEMDYIESMKFTRDDILVAFGTPKPIVAITDDVNLANAETAMRIYLGETVKPETDAIVEKINEALISPDFGENLFLDFPDPTPENRTQTLADYDSGLTKGWLTINEVRGRENLEPVDGGDSILLPFSLAPIGAVSQQPAPAIPAEEVQKMRKQYYERQRQNELRRKLKVFNGRGMLRTKMIVIEECIKHFKKTKGKTKKEKAPAALIKGDDLRNKYMDVVLKAIDRRASKFKTELNKLAAVQGNVLLAKLKSLGELEKGLFTKSTGSEAKKVVKEFYKSESKVWAEFAFPFVEEFAKQSGMEAMGMVAPDKEFKMTEKITKTLKQRAKEFGLGVNETTRDRITEAIDEGIKAGQGMAEISDSINSIYKEFPTWRSDMISRTESTAANNEGFMEAYKQSGVATHKEWVATMDDRTRDEHAMMNGEIVKVSDNFSNGLPYPQEPNCRCVLAPAFEE